MRRAVLAPIALALLWAEGASAQQDSDAATGLVPTFGAGADYLESRGRTNGSNGREGILRLSPGLRYTQRGGVIRGSLDYTANLLERAGIEATAGGQVQNALNAAFVAEAVPSMLFVDLRASISQQSITAFGQQFTDSNAATSNNRTEVRSVSLSPSFRAAIGGLAQLDVRATAGTTRSSRVEGTDSTNQGGSMSLQTAGRGALLGAAIELSSQATKYEGQSAVRDDRIVASLSATPDPTLKMKIRGGRETLAVDQGGDNRLTTTYGASLQWAPGPRTLLAIDGDRRYFGRSGRLTFSQRFQRTSISYTGVRDTTSGADGFSLVQSMTQAELLSMQLASSIPDEAQRAAVVQSLLAASGIDPNQLVSIGIQSNRVSVQQRQDLAFVWLGQRLSFNLLGFVNKTYGLTFIEGLAPIVDEPVRQHGYSLTSAYQLTPATSVRLVGSRTMVFSTSSQAGNDLKSAGLSLTTGLGRNASVSLGARYTVFNSTIDPYRETSVSASLNLRF